MTNMKKIAYFPGCTLSSKAKDLDQKARAVVECFGYQLIDIPDWTCCGAVFPNSLENVMKFVGPYTMLATTAQESDQLVTLCSACFNVMKRTNKVIRENPDIQEILKDFTELDYHGEVKVLHYIEFLRDEVTFEKIKQAVQKRDRTHEVDAVAPYYGCLLLRPHDELDFDDPENPSIIADLIEAVGGKVVKFPSQNECCGAYLTVHENEDCLKPAKAINEEAKEHGATKIITSCPLCYYNLDKAGKLPTVYFTEYLAQALLD